MECACRHRVTSLQTAVREAGRGPAGPELTADAGIGPLLPPAPAPSRAVRALNAADSRSFRGTPEWGSGPGVAHREEGRRHLFVSCEMPPRARLDVLAHHGLSKGVTSRQSEAWLWGTPGPGAGSALKGPTST